MLEALIVVMLAAALLVIRLLDHRESAWLAPVPYSRDRSYWANVRCFWRWRGLSWRIPFTSRIGWFVPFLGEWRRCPFRSGLS